MLKAVLDELMKHGVDIHDYFPIRENGLPVVSVILRNMEEGRELLNLAHWEHEEVRQFLDLITAKENAMVCVVH